MEDVNIFKFTVSNISFVDSEDGVLLFIYSAYEVNTDDVRFVLTNQNGTMELMLHYQSDNVVTIKIENETLFQRLQESNMLKIFEVDFVDGDILNYYNAKG